MDFSEELASLIARSSTPHKDHQSSHERSTNSPPSTGDSAFDDWSYHPNANHNVFCISAPTNDNHHRQQQPLTLCGQFSLNPAQTHPAAQQHHNLYEFNPNLYFRTTLPGLDSSARYDHNHPRRTFRPMDTRIHHPPPFTLRAILSITLRPLSPGSNIRRLPSLAIFIPYDSRFRSRSQSQTTPGVDVQQIVIPSSHPQRTASQHAPTSTTSPLSLRTRNENSHS